MVDSFARVKSVINRLREVLQCQICFQIKEEDSMIFYHVCDHFFCRDCLKNDKICPLCNNPLDKPTEVINDKNILSLYQSLAKFELPSKEEIGKIFRSVKDQKLKGGLKSSVVKEAEIIETPKNQKKGSLRESRKNVTPDFTEGEVTPKVESTSKKGKDVVTPTARRNITPTGKGRSTTPVTASAGSSKRSTSLSKMNINKRNPKGETQLHLACKKSNFAAMAELIAAGANLNAQDNAGWTPLHDSVFSGNVEVIKFLLDNGAKVNAPGLENTTALHEAIAKGNVNIVKLLLEYGADVKAMNIFRETPLDLVTKYKLDEMKEVLLEASKSGQKMLEVETYNIDEALVLYKHNLTIEDEKLVNKFVENFQGETTPFLSWKDPPSHIITSREKIKVTWALISSVPTGPWIVNMDWVKDCLKEDTLKSASEYEVDSLPGFSRARGNKLKQLPGLFSGCHFFFGGNFELYTVENITIGKEDLKTVVEKNGGVILKRCPDPESLALEKTVPFHADSSTSLRDTSYFIVYQTDKWDPKPKYNMSHMKTLPVEWLMCCLLRFQLLDPNRKDLSWSDILDLR